MHAHSIQRRLLLQAGSALSLLGMSPYAASKVPSRAQVVVIGGGYGGATAAKYVRWLSHQKISVVLIEPDPSFISCPLSNLVIGGSGNMGQITSSYASLSRHHGVTMVRDYAQAVDTERKVVRLLSGSRIAYDKLVVAPGVEMRLGSLEGYASAHARGQLVHAWKAGAETVLLRQQLLAMPDGGVFAITIPLAPYRCPPGPYERACQVAWYLQRHKPKSKVLVLDANADVTSKGALFKEVWANPYKGLVEYRPNHRAVGVDVKNGLIQFEVQEDVKANVINALPEMRAGKVAVDMGLADQADGHWCGVHYQTFESTAARDVFVIGDAIQIAPLMPKSGHMANAQAKVAAAAIVAQLSGIAPNPHPMLTNTCYSFVDDQRAIHVASVHAYVNAEQTFKTVHGSGGLSSEPSLREGIYAHSWATNMWADVLR